MFEPIEFFEIPERYEIILEFVDNRVNRKCRCDLSHGNVITEVYDESGDIIATSMNDLAGMGVAKATLVAYHEIDFSKCNSAFESIAENWSGQ